MCHQSPKYYIEIWHERPFLLHHALQTITITWPFAVWGLDLVGPLQKAPGGFTHLLVAIDKFSKWIEARPIGKIKSKQAILFFIDIIFRFGVPNSIITDNGTQFTKTVKSSPMLGTYSSCVASILRISSYLCIACTRI